MAEQHQDDELHWRLATWECARREAVRRWAELPLEVTIVTLREVQALAQACERKDRRA